MSADGRCGWRMRRGPAVGGACLGIDTDSSQTRTRVPIAARQSVHCVPVMDVALGRIKRQGYVKERSETRIALALEVYHSAANGDVDDSPNNEWSDRGLQVFDLKGAAALSCSYTIGTDHAESHTITVARTCMHHAPSRGCCQASVLVGGRRQTDMNPATAGEHTLPDAGRHQA